MNKVKGILADNLYFLWYGILCMGENKQNKRQRPFLRVSAFQTPLFFAFHCQLRK